MNIDLPPQDNDTETACIASVLLSRDALYRVTEILRPEDFYLETHRIIFSAIIELEAKSMPVDVNTLRQRLSDQNLLEKIGGYSALASFYQSVSTSANAGFYAKRIKELSIRRSLIDVSTKSIEQCYDQSRETAEVIDEIERNVFAVTERRITSTYRQLDEILKDTMNDIIQWYDTKKSVTGTPSGFQMLDELLTGFHGSELIIVAARPGMGKTALAVNMMNNIALKEPEKAVLFFSLEMPAQQLALRLLCIQSMVDSQLVRTGRIKPEELKRLFAAKEALGKERVFIDDTPSVNIMEMRSKARILANKTPISLIIVDYLQLITSMSRIDRHLQIAEITRSLKQLARELDVPVMALAQLSRAVEQRTGHVPTLADLRESGAIEQDADVVIFIYSEEKSKEDSERKGEVDLIIAKQRNGPIGTVSLKFFAQYTKFGDLDRQHEGFEFASLI
ncbi:MAG: replicative DNA helicase [Spirochaetia bacterium]|jgi:replicative DNA helicase|nr:replicative DNA helicase [Spirochaetia bacterium]